MPSLKICRPGPGPWGPVRKYRPAYTYRVCIDLTQVIQCIFISKHLLPATFCEWCEWLTTNGGVWGFCCVSGPCHNSTHYCTIIIIIIIIITIIVVVIIIIIIILVITFMHGIYNYVPATNYISRVYNVAAVVYLQFVLHVLLLLLFLWDECFTNCRHFVNGLSNLYCKMLIIIIYNVHFPVVFKSIKWLSP